MSGIEIVYKGDRESELLKLNRDANNTAISLFNRKRAATARDTILDQIKDKTLVSLRSRLIKATRAGDITEANKIQLLMRDYLKEEKETGDY